MAALNTTQKATLTRALDLMEGNLEKPLDSTVAETISTLYVQFGYPSRVAYLEALRDKPFSTLIESIRAL